MTRVQANIDKDVVERVNYVLKSIGQTPTSVINSLYHAIDNTGTIPFKMGLTSEQRDSLEIQRLALKEKPKVIKNAKEFDEIWQDEDED
ncbi:MULTISPECIES: type II toxin-antitoxin system RelB/DinJ family antitoxin [Lactobacillus]|uniref:type II toxin-antitoxin system RelB/DinJ family antitoxin n=1 Tax=Lactobacillus TaxID=1578 RepID=UPI000CD8669B|nr:MULTISPECIES: type II toxin-antitoxin system RelB/DinJ family antitoxin [Lactobacillus]RVU73125.1 hypothetical protein EJK20_09550 [Lactobacillus xujianguonis]